MTVRPWRPSTVRRFLPWRSPPNDLLITARERNAISNQHVRRRYLSGPVLNSAAKGALVVATGLSGEWVRQRKRCRCASRTTKGPQLVDRFFPLAISFSQSFFAQARATLWRALSVLADEPTRSRAYF